MLIASPSRPLSALAVLWAALAASGATLCVTPGRGKTCSHTIQAAVTAASPGDTVRVWPGQYHESVTISKSLSLIAVGPVIVDAAGLPNAIFVDGTHSPVSGVVVKGFTVRNAE